MASDTIIVRMSSKGQIVIPAAVRRRLGWTTGQRLRVRAESAGQVVQCAQEQSAEELQAALERFRALVRESGRDLVEELHERRRRERAAWAWVRRRQ